jgi:hypothetical protein
MIAYVDAALLQSGIQSGQQVVLICGYPVGAQRPPNMALLHTVGSDGQPGAKNCRKQSEEFIIESKSAEIFLSAFFVNFRHMDFLS